MLPRTWISRGRSGWRRPWWHDPLLDSPVCPRLDRCAQAIVQQQAVAVAPSVGGDVVCTPSMRIPCPDTDATTNLRRVSLLTDSHVRLTVQGFPDIRVLVSVSLNCTGKVRGARQIWKCFRLGPEHMDRDRVRHHGHFCPESVSISRYATDRTLGAGLQPHDVRGSRCRGSDVAGPFVSGRDCTNGG